MGTDIEFVGNEIVELINTLHEDNNETIFSTINNSLGEINNRLKEQNVILLDLVEVFKAKFGMF